MMRKALLLSVTLLALVLPFHPATRAEEAKTAEMKSAAEMKSDGGPLEETKSVTQHTLKLNGQKIDYTATAGTLILKDDEQKSLASVFYIAYTKNGVDDPAGRPITFSFNGGPGAAAIWVNLGAFGPKKVLADDEGFPTSTPGRLVDNPYSTLDVTDLVFIDPVETGLSRKAKDADGALFHGLRADVQSVGEFIRLWTTRNTRWSSPKFLAGESYGTTRAAGLANYLQGEYGMYLNGIVMISTILNWQNAEFAVGNDLPYLIHLPTYAATAWYHKKLAPELQADLGKTLAEAERFALSEYALALLQGQNLPAEQRRAVAEKVARYTGLSTEFVEQCDLRVVLWRYLKELRRDDGLTVGRLDSRFTGYDRDTAGEGPEFDPSMEAVSRGYVTLMNDYLRRELQYETDLVYRSLSRKVWPWKWEGLENQYASLSEDLRQAMTRNTDLKVLFTSGYYDFATPYFDTIYTVNHLGLPEDLRDNVSIEFYEAGHMMYIRTVDHDKFKKDIVEFMRKAL